ncbi:hypothetical protein RVBP18_3590 [Pseudomonas phage sp. LC]|nr:hypothetical protein RVBP18_3590 [Pseudomonas phage sp. LC]
MLKLPASDESFRVLALDPGSQNLGIAILEDKLDGSNKVVRNAFTCHLKDTNPAYAAISEVHGSRFTRMQQMSDAVLNILHTEKPHAVIVESNYLGKFAQSFAVLVECVTYVHRALYEYDRFIPLYMIDPTTVKINAGMKKVKGTTKDDVKEAMRSRTDITWNIDIDSLDDHSMDACAIAYYYLTRIV